MRSPRRLLLAGGFALPMLVAASLVAQVPIGKAPNGGGKVPLDYSAPPPRLTYIGGSPTTTSLTWVATGTGRLIQTEVTRSVIA